MANLNPDIKPGGLTQKGLVDLLYQIVSSIYGFCVKLDADGTVPLTTYTANCYTAIFTGIFEDSQGNRTGLTGDYMITPTGVSDAGLLQALYEIFNAIETLTEQLDADTLTLATYELNGYTNILTHMVTDSKGNTLGNGNTYWFKPGGVDDETELVDCLYNIVNSLETIMEQLDGDGTPTDTNYEALWFTANITTRIQNSQGNVLGANVSGSF